MEQPLDPQRLAAWRSFLEAHRGLIDRLAAELEAARGLPLTWYDVLVNLQEAGGRLRMHELAHRIILSPSGLTRLVDRMSDAGLVHREQDDADRRGTWVVLDPEGWTTLREGAPVHLAGVAEHFGRHLDDEEARVLHRALARVSEALDRPRATTR